MLFLAGKVTVIDAGAVFGPAPGFLIPGANPQH